ncbi:MAG: winged helix-turn-helix domain-containing protein, partial [Candidatus Binatia bacterium]
MKIEQSLFFAPFHLDLLNEQLWREDALFPLRPKTFAVLRYLVEHPDRLVTRQELLQALWPGTYVSEGLLRGYIRDLRAVLGDDAGAPRFIETVERRGYRWIAPLTPPQPGVSSQYPVVSRE